jgi:cell fate regulator YaaT (PSP1 superfamily)
MGIIHRVIDWDFTPKEKPRNVLRVATYEDQEKLLRNREMEEESREQCEEMIARHGLDMKLVDVEYQFDCNKLTFYFTADQRVDFRALVKDLAATYRTRIELRQIGVRDEARRLGGFGVCGLQQCCNSFIRDFEPISTQMARDQNLSLNPAKISGNCGRLLCCLQYEHQHYLNTAQLFPDIGSTYEGKLGIGRVDSIDVFEQLMSIRYEDGSYEKISLIDYLYRRKYQRPQTTEAAPEEKPEDELLHHDPDLLRE